MSPELQAKVDAVSVWLLPDLSGEETDPTVVDQRATVNNVNRVLYACKLFFVPVISNGVFWVTLGTDADWPDDDRADRYGAAIDALVRARIEKPAMALKMALNNYLRGGL